MTDESTDITNLNQFITYIRFYYYNLTFTHFLDVRELSPQSQTAENLEAIFISICEDYNLDLNYCVGICTDGTASMVGKRAGMVTKIKQNYNGIQTFQCVAHRWILAAEDTSKLQEQNLITKINSVLFKIVILRFNVSEECYHISINTHN
ncbi:MAG: hypothetical protein EZS28_009017 [Streblomastix strix]|uniref:DUF4371 domain-containing protein n=1 Tax=Streblomastix strix TaxID=222440 RepID=A0A5J4WMI1_9EUKA|nr:MAG: hypothetical protein EZS28_009017 [Streblomastix strix]